LDEPPKPAEPDLTLTERELADCKEVIGEIQNLCNANLSIDFQKQQILQTIANKQLEQMRISNRIKKRLGLPDNQDYGVNLDKGILVPQPKFG
jgi:hypothetical protein